MIKVGLCDDITDYNKKMENYIIRYGNENHLKVKITAYGSGSQLLLNFQKRKFDIIFLDVSMPELDGFETAERIRSIDENVVIVFCTSFYTISNAGKGFEVDAEDFLSKPLLYKKVECTILEFPTRNANSIAIVTILEICFLYLLIRFLLINYFKYFFSSSTLSNLSHGRLRSFLPKCP